MKTLLCLLACLLFVACGGDNQEAASQATTEGDASHAEATTDDHGHSHDGDADHAHAGPVAAGTYAVACGCTVEGVGKCGNYIEVAGTNYEIANGSDMGLGKMEWCGQSGNTAEAEGEIQDGMFVATTLTVQ